jgi:hypothetical protein
LAPGITIVLSNDASVAVTVWGTLPVFVKVTLVPAVTVSAAGVNVLSPIATAAVAWVPACAGGVVCAAGVGVAIGVGALAGAGGSCATAVDGRWFGVAVAVAATTTLPTMPGWKVHL